MFAWRGKVGKQRRCSLCSNDTTWVCGKCTTGLLSLWPLCPESSVARKGPKKGVKTDHACLSKHRMSPSWLPRCKRPACGTKSKRAQGSPDAPSADEQAQDCEEDEDAPKFDDE